MTPHAFPILTLICLMSSQTQGLEISLIAGLNISHASESRYYDYRQQPKENGELRNGYWVSEYPIEKMNEGFAKNKLVGLNIAHNKYSATLLTYRNSYYQSKHPDRSWGLGLNRIYSIFSNWNIQAGAMLLTGYRQALLTGSKSASRNKSNIFTYTLTSEYKVTNSASIIHTLQGDNVHITSLMLAIF